MLSGPIVIFSIIALVRYLPSYLRLAPPFCLTPVWASNPLSQINILITLFQMLITVKRQQILAQQEKPKKKKKND